MYNVGVLYQTQEFLRMVHSAPLTPAGFRASFPRFHRVRCEDILSTALQCQWITTIGDGHIQLTPSGLAVVEEPDGCSALRRQLLDLIRFVPPSWSGLLQRGRNAIKRYANLNVVQCFQDAGLLGDPELDVIRWWDMVSVPARSARDAKLLETGRRGEWLSLLYEEARVGKRPEWISVDNNDAGYDLLSRLARDTDEVLVIEVKASEEPWEDASFYLSRNEWTVLSTHKHAVIHLWSVSSIPVLHCQLAVSHVNHHIPRDGGSGQWQSVRIPYVAAGSGVPWSVNNLTFSTSNG